MALDTGYYCAPVASLGYVFVVAESEHEIVQYGCVLFDSEAFLHACQHLHM